MSVMIFLVSMGTSIPCRCRFLFLLTPGLDELLAVPIGDLQSFEGRFPGADRDTGELVVPQRAVPLVPLAVDLCEVPRGCELSGELLELVRILGMQLGLKHAGNCLKKRHGSRSLPSS